jgi:hypothetical protein
MIHASAKERRRRCVCCIRECCGIRFDGAEVPFVD